MDLIATQLSCPKIEAQIITEGDEEDIKWELQLNKIISLHEKEIVEQVNHYLKELECVDMIVPEVDDLKMFDSKLLTLKSIEILNKEEKYFVLFDKNSICLLFQNTSSNESDAKKYIKNKLLE